MKRTDSNQQLIVHQLRHLGCSVAVLSGVGKGFPDLIVGRAGQNYLIELKDGSKPPSQRKLTPDEIRFFHNWRGQVNVCGSLNEILDVIQPTLTTK